MKSSGVREKATPQGGDRGPLSWPSCGPGRWLTVTTPCDEERAEDFIPMFEAGDIQASAEATDHSVSSLLGLALCWALRRDWEQGGRLEFVLEELRNKEGRSNVLTQGSPCSPTTRFTPITSPQAGVCTCHSPMLVNSYSEVPTPQLLIHSLHRVPAALCTFFHCRTHI